MAYSAPYYIVRHEHDWKILDDHGWLVAEFRGITCPDAEKHARKFLKKLPKKGVK